MRYIIRKEGMLPVLLEGGQAAWEKDRILNPSISLKDCRVYDLDHTAEVFMGWKRKEISGISGIKGDA
jgi:hypothetical protein